MMAGQQQSRRKATETGKRSRAVISTITAFILAIVCMLFTSILAVYLGFFHTNNIITSFNKVDYYNRTMEHFNENAWDITIPMGLPQEVLEDVVDINKVSRDVKGGLTAGLDQSDYTVDTVQIEEQLDQNVKQHFASQGTSLDENQTKVLEEYKDTIVTEYLSSVQIPLIRYFGYAKNFYHTIMLVGIPVCMILIVCAATLLIKLRQWKHRGIRYITYATLAAMLMSAALPAGILLTGVYKKLQVAPDYFYDFLMRYIQGGFMVFAYFAVIWLLISISLLLLTKTMRKKLINQRKRN